MAGDREKDLGNSEINSFNSDSWTRSEKRQK